MTRRPPSRSLTAVLAVSLSMAGVVMLLALSPQSMAQARKAACSSPSAAHSKGSPHTCTQSQRTSKTSRKSHAHARPTVKGRHLKHAAGKKKAAKGTPAKRTAKSPAGTSQTLAICEDGSSPVRAGDGSFSCDDESAPSCEAGAAPVPSSNGLSLVCGAAAKGAFGSTEAMCEDGTAPVPAGNGSFSCDDGSEPTCEDESEPTPAGDHSLQCNGVGHDESAG